MKVKYKDGYIGDSQDQQYFKSKQIPYACVQVGVSNFTFSKDFAELLVETQPFETASYEDYTNYEQFCKLFKGLSEEHDQYAGQLKFLFYKLTPNFVKVDTDFRWNVFFTKKWITNAK